MTIAYLEARALHAGEPFLAEEHRLAGLVAERLAIFMQARAASERLARAKTI